jgi:hypothetical protein
MNLVPNMNRNNVVDRMGFYNFYSLHCSVGCASMIASPSKKRPIISMRSKVRGFYGTLSETAGDYASI